jgi:hypothetical protein
MRPGRSCLSEQKEQMENHMSEVRSQPARPPNDDEVIERDYIFDYISLGLLINFRSLIVLLRAARELPDEIDRKSICLSAWQGLLSSYEDFAVLLHAILRKKQGRHLHHGLGFERQQRQGSTDVPGILKRYESPRDFLDTLGFDSLDLEALRRFGIDVPDEQTFSDYYRDFAVGVREIGEYQQEYNDFKNRLKHGKAVISGGEGEITFVTWNGGAAPPGWDRTHIRTTLHEIEVAVIQTAKIYIKSLDFLLSFMMQYHPAHVAEFQRIAHERYGWCVQQVRAVGLKSEGLTNA